MGRQGVRWLVPAVGAMAGVLALSGPAAGVDVGPASVPGAGELVPPSELPSTSAPPPVSTPAPAPPARVVPHVEAPPVESSSAPTGSVPKLQTPRQLQSEPKLPSPSASPPRTTGSTTSTGSSAQGGPRGVRSAQAPPPRVALRGVRPAQAPTTPWRQRRTGGGGRAGSSARRLCAIGDCAGRSRTCRAACRRSRASTLPCSSFRAGLGDRAPLSRPQAARRLGTSTKRVGRAERRGIRGLENARRRGACGVGATDPAVGGGRSLGLTDRPQHAPSWASLALS
jgi:hypothetical protein